MSKYKVGDIVKLSTGEKGTITKAWGRYSATIGDDDYDEYNFDEKEIIGLWEGYKPKLKLIDILNKIANGELKEGTKVNLIADDYLTKLYYDGELIRFVASDNIYAFTCKDINDEDEYELIEPNDFGKADKMAEPTDITKIEELIDWYQLIDGTTDEEKIRIVWNKLNEVTRYINKG